MFDTGLSQKNPCLALHSRMTKLSRNFQRGLQEISYLRLKNDSAPHETWSICKSLSILLRLQLMVGGGCGNVNNLKGALAFTNDKHIMPAPLCLSLRKCSNDYGILRLYRNATSRQARAKSREELVKLLNGKYFCSLKNFPPIENSSLEGACRLIQGLCSTYIDLYRRYRPGTGRNILAGKRKRQ